MLKKPVACYRKGKPTINREISYFPTGKYLNPILHKWLRGSCFTCGGSSTIQVYPLLLNIGMEFNSISAGLIKSIILRVKQGFTLVPEHSGFVSS
jgi:hypothetical protein